MTTPPLRAYIWGKTADRGVRLVLYVSAAAGYDDAYSSPKAFSMTGGRRGVDMGVGMADYQT